jgi:tetratricopeptide (TPR) repeat protein
MSTSIPKEKAGRDKIVVLAFRSFDLEPKEDGFEEAFVFGLLQKIGLFTSLQVKDLATKKGAHSIPPGLSETQFRQEVQKMATANRSRYVLCGNTVTQQKEANAHKAIRFRLYDTHEERLVIDDTFLMPLSFRVDTPSEGALISMKSLNEAMNWGLFHVLTTVLPYEAGSLISESATHQFTDNFQAFQRLIQAEKNTSDMQGKIDLYEHVLAMDPNFELAYFNIAKLYKSVREYRQCVTSYSKAYQVSTSSDTVKALYCLEAGIGCALLGHQPQAFQWWLKSIALNPTLLNPYLNIAHIYEEIQHYDQAEAFFRKAYLLAPDDSRNCYNLARIYSKQGQMEKSLEYYQKQLVYSPEDPWCHSNIATTMLQLDMSDKALHHLERTAELDPEGEAGEYAKLVLMQYQMV